MVKYLFLCSLFFFGCFGGKIELPPMGVTTGIKKTVEVRPFCGLSMTVVDKDERGYLYLAEYECREGYDFTSAKIIGKKISCERYNPDFRLGVAHIDGQVTGIPCEVDYITRRAFYMFHTEQVQDLAVEFGER